MPFGATGRDVPRIGQGTWNMERDPQRAVAALRHGIDHGLTHIDTAEIYGDGAAEEVVGRAIAGRRSELFLVSKVHPARAGRDGLAAACEESLRRLRTDYLDVYLLHWLPPHPVAEVVAGFETLAAAGKILHWGVSNLDDTTLARFVEEAGPDRIACNQVMHHLGQRAVEHAVVPYCREQRIAVVGYSPFGAGRFPPRRRKGTMALQQVAAATGATPRQVALAFLLERSGGFTIPKAADLRHVEENAGAAGLVLPEEALRLLEAAFPRGRPVASIPLW